MERRKSASKSPAARDAAGRKSGRKKPKKVDLATTALGETPPKRGLKKTAAPAKKKSDTVAGSGEGQRELAVNVKTGRYRKHSSTLWLHRQLNDPFVARAKAEGYRSRAAYKLVELNEKFELIGKGARVVDLGCAPGGWCQVAARAGAAKIVGIDYLNMDAIAGVDILEMDFLEPEAPDALKAKLGGEADVVLSDMAAPTTGHRATDHLRIVALAETALDFALEVLAPGGSFVSKVFAGGAEGELLVKLKQNFTSVKHAKPKASRPESAEKYVVATGFKGRKA